ncbi:MAG: hypothetical protein IPI60_09995 [Saprospiraceae bacterium]|nr:hypothetical protein [Saprospiraceae bacterium]
MRKSLRNAQFFLFLPALFLLSFSWQQNAQAQVLQGISFSAHKSRSTTSPLLATALPSPDS